ncbi:hypothetical protein EC2845650_1302 [Escherichia coli 2845650]|nr:hypothetical protein EC2845650_1302 [Escherichia coli 2845650]KDY90893.1 hypothetical protein AB64_3294 [Escherichia coli 2-427-07_S1_C3]
MIGHIVLIKNKDEKWHTVQGFTTIKELTLLASLLLFFFLIDLLRHQALRRTPIRHRVNRYMPCGH